MDAIIPENIPYLSLINDKINPDSFLQNGENTNYEDPISAGYTEGQTIWEIDGVPVCMNGSMLDETPILLNQPEKNNELGFPVEIPEKGIMTPSNLYFSNELLLQLNSQNQEISVEPKSPLEILSHYVLKKDSSVFTNLLENKHCDEIVKFKDSVENVEQLTEDAEPVVENEEKVVEESEIREELDDNNLLQYVEVVSVLKCRKCYSLFEDYDLLLNHLENECQVLPQTNVENFGFEIQKSQFCPKIQRMTSLIKTDENKQPKDIFLCGMCENIGYESIDEVKKHMVKEHDLSYDEVNVEENSLQIQNEPTKKFLNRTCFKSIVEKQKMEGKRIKCLVVGCDSRFQRVELMMRHHECHVEGEKKKFKCPECDKIFFLWRLCSAHMWKCHKVDLDQFTCPLCCGYKSLSPRNLLAHMATHESAQTFKPFLCGKCGQDFKLLSQLKNHEAKHNATEEVQVHSSFIMKKSCPTCKKFFSCAKAMKKHVQAVHNKFKPFICNICGHNTTRKSMLEMHLRQHTGEKPYKCEICDYKTGDHNSLRRHKLRHFGKSPYSCPFCNYQTIQSISIKTHIKRKHPGQEGFYKCLLCPFESVSGQLHMDHMKEHEITDIKDNLEDLNSKSSDLLKMVPNIEDEETQPGLFADPIDDTIDTGGITIPAELEMQVE